jgi:hypothetical protein
MDAPQASTMAAQATGAKYCPVRVWAAVVWVVLAISGNAADLLDQARQGPMKEAREIVFAVRGMGPDGHWYANFGEYAPQRMCKIPLFTNGGSLRVLDLDTGKQRVLLEDAQGGIRDPQVHYSGKKIVFSYRAGGTLHYHLHEIGSDGSGLRKLTDGDFDDIEPTYLPNDEIVFVSSRCNRWVNCWLTPVATLHRCNADGGNIRAISINIEHDNTPWLLPDGRLLYTRWEYIDRSQVHYHHLWTANPDGTAPMTYYGNLEPGVVMIDSKPIPGSEKVISVFSPGHGQKEHAGPLAIVDPKAGPDDKNAARRITEAQDYRDPWAFSEQCVLAARGRDLVLLDGAGREERIRVLSEDELKAGLWCHEPRPLGPRPRETAVVDRVRPGERTGSMVLMDVRLGRKMEGVGKDEIKELLVLESLPKPINFTGGMEPLSYGGTFTLERVLGTVPVEPDGSAHFELPAMRSVFFVALDANGRSVKRMQSFTGVQPGEALSCVGCHEQRSSAPPQAGSPVPLAASRPPDVIKPVRNTPDVFDYPRDIQPIMDRHCVKCHNTDKADGGVILTGDRGPMYSHGYFSLTVTGQFADGRNRAESNFPPRALGSGAAPLLKKLEGGHYEVKADERELLTTRLWIDTGAPYPGTYAALGSGMIGGYENNEQVIGNDSAWPETRGAAAVIDRRCLSCHEKQPLPHSLSDEIGFSFWMPDLKDRRIRRNRHIVFNLTQPDKSLMLLAPLAKSAGGHGSCREKDKAVGEGAVFTGTDDADYQAILAMCAAGKRHLDDVKRFDMPGFKPRPEWVGEMKRCGILPTDFDPSRDPIDVYATEQSYWKSLHYQPPTAAQP